MDIRIYDEVCWGYCKLMPIVKLAMEKKNMKANRRHPIPIIGDQNEHKRLGFTDDLPILMINGTVKSKGRLPSIKEIIKMIEEEENLESE